MKHKIPIIITIGLIIMLSTNILANNDQFLGYWIGAIRVMDTELEIHLELQKESGEFQGLITIPAQLQRDLQVEILQIDYPEISFRLDVGTIANFQGSIKDGYLSGTFSQAGVNGLFHLVRGDKSAVRYDTLELEPLEGEMEISVETSYGRLFGSILLPEEGDKFPVVLIIPGSGPTDRDGNNPMIPGKGYVYRQIAESLRDNGIASLRYDKRGIGRSREALIKEEDLRIDYKIQDVVQWVKLLKNDERFSKIVLLGHSQGSLLGIIAAQREEVSGLISAAGAGRNMADVLIEQFAVQPEPFKSEAEDIIASLRSGQTVPRVSEELHSVFRSQIQPYLISMMRYNPSVEIAKLDIPVLIIQGTTDIQISLEDARALSNSLIHAELKIIDDMNHMFRISSLNRQENISTYGNPELPLADGFMNSIIDFISKL